MAAKFIEPEIVVIVFVVKYSSNIDYYLTKLFLLVDLQYPVQNYRSCHESLEPLVLGTLYLTSLTQIYLQRGKGFVSKLVYINISPLY
jgi:hypothetical protein